MSVDRSLTSRPRIILCDDDNLIHMSFKTVLKADYQVHSAYNVDEAAAILRNRKYDLLLLDIEMRSPDEGLEGIPLLLEIQPDLPIVMVTARVDFAAVKAAVAAGAMDYFPKENSPEELKHAIDRALMQSHLRVEGQVLSKEITRSDQKHHLMLGKSKSIEDLRQMITKIRKNPSVNVVIFGETGTGKEVVARQLRRSLDSQGTLEPFVAVDSSTIQSSMAESLLFGHVKGAFTGADQNRKGLFEDANGGIIYFDEISNMPLSIQAKLLRVIEEKEITPLGSNQTTSLNFRVICATNRDLDAMVKKGEFKEDLLARLNVIQIQLPPLRERKEDIPLLVQHFARTSAPMGRSSDKEVVFSETALEAFEKYSWPGNIRELRNAVAYILTLFEGEEVEWVDLPPKLRDSLSKGSADRLDGDDFYAQVASFEEKVLREAYLQQAGNISKMATVLKMDRSHLYSKLKTYGIHNPRNGS